jgi:alpha-glucosidase (family GH31 glycosyl hydrolase)
MAEAFKDTAAPRQEDAALHLATPAGELRITACTDQIVRLRLGPGQRVPLTSYLPEADAWSFSGAERTPGALRTSALALTVSSDPAALLFSGTTGHPLLRLAPATGIAVDRARSVAADAGEAAGAAETQHRLTLRFSWIGEQHFYGLGEGGKQFDRLDGVRPFWNSHFVHGTGSDIGVPLLLSTAGYALFFDTTADAEVVVGRTERDAEIVYRVDQGAIDCYFLAGATLRALLGTVARLLGSPALPPRWSLGFLQSTRHFTDQAEVQRLAQTLRAKQIPCDGVVFLSTYGDAKGWNRGVGHLEFEPDLFADPASAIGALRAQGFQVITHEYPVLHPQSPLLAEAERRGFLLSEGYRLSRVESHPTTEYHEGQRFIDFSNPEARAWWWEQHRALADLGVAGWWLDGGEGPSSAAALQGGTGRDLHNVYDRLRQQGFAEGESSTHPDRRPFLLCRSGAAGMQRYGATCWSGDINNTFATLEAQIPLGLNTGLSGIPYWGMDIGGFFHPQPETAELYARWFQFGAFCPGFRAHGTIWREHVPWAFGPEIEAICRRYVELRYRLLPYTCALAWQAYLEGLPLMRPLVLNYPDDPSVWELGSQYLWGDDLLVAPVTRAGATAWPVYLPAGTWYDFWTHQRHTGPRGVTVEAPLDRLPLFVRAGALLPLAPLTQFDGERMWDEITVLVYPEGDGSFDLYDDDGRTRDYQSGRFACTALSSRVRPGSVTVRIETTRGDPSVIPPGRIYILQVLAPLPRRVTANGAPVTYTPDGAEAGQAAFWHDGAHCTFVRLDQTPVSVELIW